MKKIKLMRDYMASPLWRIGDEWGNRLGPINLDELPLSEILRDRLRAWQKRKDDYFRIMEKIPGGGWSYHTEEDFEKARVELALPPFPNDVSDEEEGREILLELRNELPLDEYEIIWGE